MNRVLLGVVGVIFSATVVAQSNRIDLVRGDAPELAHFGLYDIGVNTLEMIARDRVDVVDTQRGSDNIIYDRSLTVELWYPADLNGRMPGVTYEAITRNPEIVAQLQGRAVRGAEPDRSNGPYPLVIISHGHPGNRFLMSHTAESLASKGYIVASIDHTDSTYESEQHFPSTLYNRPLENGPRPVGVSGYRIRATGNVKSRYRNTCQAFRSPETVVHTPRTNCHACLDAWI